MPDVLEKLRDAVGNGHVHPAVAEAILHLADRLSPPAEVPAEADPTAKGGE